MFRNSLLVFNEFLPNLLHSGCWLRIWSPNSLLWILFIAFMFFQDILHYWNLQMLLLNWKNFAVFTSFYVTPLVSKFLCSRQILQINLHCYRLTDCVEILLIYVNLMIIIYNIIVGTWLGNIFSPNIACVMMDDHWEGGGSQLWL